MDLFKGIVDGCKNFPRKIKRIDFGKDGEPFVNKNFPEMVRYLKGANVADMIAVTTNGALLTEQRVDAIIDAGIDMIKISIEAVSDRGYKDITKVDVKYRDI
jgi:molybdenum cofactor biosynthesis enzyme MoaA